MRSRPMPCLRWGAFDRRMARSTLRRPLGLGGTSFMDLILSCQVHNWHLARSVLLPTIMEGAGFVHNDGRYQAGAPLVSGDTGGTMR
jgi:hypothetical protein